MEIHEGQSILEMLHHEHYTPRELADLLGTTNDFVCQAAFRGDLIAEIVGHDIVRIQREDVITWLEKRQNSDAEFRGR